jgi:hypothetical protein
MVVPASSTRQFQNSQNLPNISSTSRSIVHEQKNRPEIAEDAENTEILMDKNFKNLNYDGLNSNETDENF